MLGTLHAARQPQGLKNLMIAHAPVAAKYWIEKYCEFRELMPEKYRSILKQPHIAQSLRDSGYLQAMQIFYKGHFITSERIPVELRKSWDEIEADSTASHRKHVSCLAR